MFDDGTMTPQKLTISSPDNGDCLRACIASLLDLPIEQVPNFMDNGKGNDGLWFSDPQDGMNAFLLRNGYEYTGYGHPKEAIQLCAGVDGYYVGVVNSVNFVGSTHAVIFHGLELAFDPSTKGQWQGIGVDALCYYMIRRIKMIYDPTEC